MQGRIKNYFQTNWGGGDKTSELRSTLLPEKYHDREGSAECGGGQ